MINKVLYERLGSVLDMMNANYRGVGSSPSAVKGSARSEFINSYLKNVIPQGLRITTSGEVIDSLGNATGELDIIIENGHFPNIPIVGNDSARLFFAEGVAAVIEVKSDLKGQWNEAVSTGTKLGFITRNFGNTNVSNYKGAQMVILNTEFNNPNLPKVKMPPETRLLKKIPYFVVGYTGWEKFETLNEKLESNKDVISGILQLDKGFFVSGECFKGVHVSGPLSLLALINAIYESYSYIKSTNADLISYGSN
ncbi:DUF6602 domain-containing protein [Serratia rubidaea]|uniref:DUF6602 domain-containing protein n=1 Tax=Serratia rubidaea TaxID=61652 RepID=UPI0022B8580A|nr:DUF6602 domain-containing protein [Serratia rubidaea]WBF43754.1 hypothetical protein OLD77_13905 [Serratia rubidaea]